VNVLADAAGCDKVLIYRYFGSLDGVLQAVGAERMLWPRVEIEGGDGKSFEDGSLAEAVRSVVLEEWAALEGGALMLQAQAAEVASGNALGFAAAEQRAERHAEIVASLRSGYGVPPYVDLPALLELLSAALTLLALRGATGGGSHSRPVEKNAQRFDPNTPEGWRRVEKTVGMLARALLES